MPARKRIGGRLFASSDFIDLSEMRKYLDLEEEQNSTDMEPMGESRLRYAGDPSDSDPGYEVPQIGMNWCHSVKSKMFHNQVTEDFETCYARAMREYERDLRLRQVQYDNRGLTKIEASSRMRIIKVIRCTAR